ncbi:hypothetical protein J6590_000399 [Homalodisca vitripennis]|nr:hypothetical protein J6590_000399 [Homalodisca vitripennis]
MGRFDKGLFNKYPQRSGGGGSNRLASKEGSHTTQAPFNSVTCGHALRQEVDFCDM